MYNWEYLSVLIFGHKHQISLWWLIHIINPVDKTKLPCYTSHRHSTTVSLETYLYDLFHDLGLQVGLSLWDSQ